MNSFYYLHQYDGEQEVIVNEDSILFKYHDEGVLEEVSVDYSDIKSVSFSRSNGYGHFLSIESQILGADSIVEIVIEEHETEKLSRCMKICEKAYEVITSNYEVHYHNCEHDEHGNTSKFYIGLNKEEDYTVGLLNLGKYILLMGGYLVFVYVLMNVING